MKRCPVVGYEGYYEVTDTGEIWSVDRVIQGRDGVKFQRTFRGQQLTPRPNTQTGYWQVQLWRDNESAMVYVHRLVAEAFIPNPHGKPEVNHKDGNRQNCHVHNLEWVTSSENSQHAVDTGLRIYTNRMTEADFLDCLRAVIQGETYKALAARVPYQVPFLSVKLRRLARKHGLEHMLDASLSQQRILRAQINGAKNQNRANA